MPNIRTLLTHLRASSKTEREKGTYFERVAVAFIKNDPGMAQEYDDAWLFSDWAAQQGVSASDTGIDVVAKVRDGEGFCAIQCKFFREDHVIQKGDIDSFFTASGKAAFSRRLIIDTTIAPWGKNAQEALQGQQIETTRIGLDRLDESPIDWATYVKDEKIVLAPKKEPREHQLDAIRCVHEGFEEHDRGKLIMACGTGKTFTGLKIAEAIVGKAKTVLFLVPSLSLMSQSVREWTIDSKIPLRSFAVCSDVQVGRRRKDTDDIAEIDVHDLDYPATTNAAKLAQKVNVSAPDRMTVVFATYQSIQVLAEAQAKHGMPEFDLIICDEAHRTTGATFPGEDQSNFVKVHDQSFLAGKKRLYMTATPRVFGEAVSKKAEEASVALSSMDNEALYGPTFFTRGFGWAVENDLLTDYKVIVLAVDEGMVSASIQKRLSDAQNELKLDDATKIVGCYKALTKAGLREDVAADPDPMHRALAFCRDIASSKLICDEFAAVVRDYLASDEGKEVEDGRTALACELKHVDGTFGAKARTERLDWLKAEAADDACRILSNARCLSEGVDVPALDAILFLHPRKSQIDVVQSVGRVMRRSPGKKMGYVILPIGVPAGMTPEEALADNERYRVVWQILNALRSHDERFDATINKLDLGADVSDQIEVIAVSNKLPTRSDKKKSTGIGQGSAVDDDDKAEVSVPGGPDEQMAFVFDEFAKAIMAKIVRKVGRRDYWENWASDIAEIAKTHITRITAVIAKEGSKEQAAFRNFLAEIRDDLNDSITEPDAIEMLAQHIITKPVFEALFSDHSFAANNPVSVAMQSVLDVLEEQNLEKEAESLQRFYDSVRRRASGIDSAEAKQRIIVELYDKFFRKAFPRMTEKLGIVYTPVEIVDFIIRSVDEVLRSEFDQNLGSEGVHIIDPFTGTGTFITRLLQSGLIAPQDLERKYRGEIHANEIVLLAYYIAAINIEAAYLGVAGGEYVPFEGICLTDTFQLYEQERDLISDLMADNSTRRARQKELDIRVIVGNPPYSVGQESDNSDAANMAYPKLDKRIQSTYVEHSTGNPRSLYDSYIRAIRWANDRIGDAGVIAYVSNAGWLDGKAADGLRKCLAAEFASIHVFHLRGNQRTSGERSRREGGKVFGSGSRTPVAISVLVKNPNAAEQGRILFHDIGDYLSREEKLAIVSSFGSIGGIERQNGWQSLVPDEHGDWLGQRDGSFQAFPPMGAKREAADFALFKNYSAGVKTNRDPWAFNSSAKALGLNMARMISFYKESLTQPDRTDLNDEKKISWSWVLRERFAKGKSASFDSKKIVKSVYRPFSPQMLYYDGFFNENRYLTPKIFPTGHEQNRAIYLTGPSSPSFSVLMLDVVPCLDVMSKGQCFPRFLHDNPAEIAPVQEDLLNRDQRSIGGERDALTDDGLAYFRSAYPAEIITKDDLFHYIYGLLHSDDYRARFADNLSKQLPRIPAVKSAKDFWSFVEAGRLLGDLHVDYENAEPYPVNISEGDLSQAVVNDPEAFYRVEKMKFGGKRPNLDKSTVIYNPRITLTGIPLEAYDYVVNGKPALEWVMERQVVKSDKDSGIVNDANRYAIETVGDPAYPLKLFQRVITVSLETMKIVRSLPKLDILEPTQAEFVH